MSVEAITWALKLPIKQSSAKFVLTVLANCASGDTWLAFPSVGYLAEATGQDRKTVMANLARLREWGLIEDSGRRMGDTKQVIVYRLRGPDMIETGPKTEQSQNRNSSENGTVPKSQGNSPVFPAKQSRFSRKESQKRDTEPSDTSGNRQEHTPGVGDGAAMTEADIEREVSPLGPLLPGLDREVLALFVRHRRVSRRPLSIQGWLQVRPQLEAIAESGGDINKSLKDAMALGLLLPVEPKQSGAANHGSTAQGSADTVAHAREEWERLQREGGPVAAGRSGGAGRAGAGDVIDGEFAVIG
ncbi:helix-turn-helix domain-containing protein [Stenotrophomonas pictorum]|uniref:helix-turn-helix domain-containing protein n=1 Tax=Stenotrophomonas pictorum TaxID=86184 RepID=UPI000A92C4A9|nr:helix-turn-helix domain-containing protein [Stenotrophomonas pictorum]